MRCVGIVAVSLLGEKKIPQGERLLWQLTIQDSFWCAKTCPKCSLAVLQPSLNKQSCCELRCSLLYDSVQGKSQFYFSRGVKLLRVLEARTDYQQLYLPPQNDTTAECMLVHWHSHVSNAASISTHNKTQLKMLVWVKQKPITWGKWHGGYYILYSSEQKKTWRWIRRQMRIFVFSMNPALFPW